MARKDIRPSNTILACDVCGRTLLRGERSDHYIHGGERKLVCELCRGRAVNEGWIPEDESLGPRATWAARDRRRSILGRFRGRGGREGVSPGDAGGESNGEVYEYDDEGFEDAVDPPAPPPVPAAPAPAPVPQRGSEVPPKRRERHVHAVPSSAEMKHARAIELFNGSEHPRTVAGISRSLGSPLVAVRAGTAEPSVVTMVVAWELSWYRFEVDLTDEANGVRIAAQGQELEELLEEDRDGNAVADEQGLLALAS